jgi:hypothetical protein
LSEGGIIYLTKEAPWTSEPHVADNNKEKPAYGNIKKYYTRHKAFQNQGPSKASRRIKQGIKHLS